LEVCNYYTLCLNLIRNINQLNQLSL